MGDMVLLIMTILGGLGIFLFGINLMGDYLKAIAGNKLKVFIEKTTNTPLKGILVGALVTAIIQSSSGTTALAVGLVRSGLMTFPQAIGIIMGANIGTTITSFIVGLNIEEYSLWFVALGALLVFFVNKEKIKQLGHIILGFGLLFFGLGLMGDSLKELLAMDGIKQSVEEMFEWLATNPLCIVLGLFTGAGITSVVQSSSATISILQKLYQQGNIPLMGALPILLGCNIGTTVTAVFACVGGGTQAKRTALVHTLFNVIGALLFMVLLYPWSIAVQWIEDVLLTPMGMGDTPSMTIAFAHIIFNFITTFALYFFIKKLVAIANKLIKDKANEEEKILEELCDYKLINESPVLALSFVKKAIEYMASLTHRFFHLTHEYSLENKEELVKEADKLEETINSLDKRTHDYLVKLMITDLDDKTSTLLSKYMDQIKDFERIGDHCKNLVEFYKIRYEEEMDLTKEGRQDLDQFYSVVLTMIDNTYSAIKKWSKEDAKVASDCEEEIDKLETFFYKRHMHRVDTGACTIINSEHYVEILSNMERIGDHLENVCESILIDKPSQYDEYNH